MQQKLRIVPCDLTRANRVVCLWHRHHDPDQGYKFALAICDESGRVRGVAIVGRPKGRESDDGWTLEVSRLATDGCANACSALYGAAARAAQALGWRKILTYTLATEPGTSLRAAGWEGPVPVNGGRWDCPSRPRQDHHPTQAKLRWWKVLGPAGSEVAWPEPEPDSKQLALALG